MERGFRHWLVAALSVLVLVACGTYPLRPSPEMLAQTHRIGILSILGEEVEARYIGLTAFNNKYHLAPPQGWELNRKSVEVASEALRQRGFEVVAIDYPRDEMWNRYHDDEKYPSVKGRENWRGHPRLPLLEDDLERLAKASGVDAFLILVPGGPTPRCGGVESCIGYGEYGYGILNWRGGNADAYLSIELFLVPARSPGVGAWSYANTHVRLPFARWEKTLDDYGEEGKGAIRAALYEAAEQEIPRGIDRMQLRAVAR